MLLTRCWKEWSNTARGKLVMTLFHATSETWYIQWCHHFGVKYQTPAEEGLRAIVLSDSLWNWQAVYWLPVGMSARLCSLQPLSLVVEGGCHDTKRYGSSEMPRQEVNWTEFFGAQTTSDTDTKQGALLLTQHSMGKLFKPLSTFSVLLFKDIGVRFVFVQKELQTVHVCRCKNAVSNVTFLLYDDMISMMLIAYILFYWIYEKVRKEVLQSKLVS